MGGAASLLPPDSAIDWPPGFIETPAIAQARLFALDAHGAQTRKYTGKPYVVHTQGVAALVAGVPGMVEHGIIAAHLHDVIEDTMVTQAQILAHFGMAVADLVFWVTDPKDPKNPKNPGAPGSRAARKLTSNQRLSRAPALAQTIKVADIIDNTKTIGTRDPEFAVRYLQEKLDTLAVLERADRSLWKRALQQVIGAQVLLGQPQDEGNKEPSLSPLPLLSSGGSKGPRP